MRARSNDGGFASMIIIMMLVLSTGAFLMSLGPRSVDAAREAETRQRLTGVHTATVRFAGDIGRLPTTLGELVTRGALPLATTATMHSLRRGWAGPYLWTVFDTAATTRDSWGRPFRYGSVDGLLAGQLASAGSDGAFGTSDDLRYPSAGVTTESGTLVVNLVIWNKSTSTYDVNPTHASDTAQNTSATLYYPTNGVQSSRSIATTGALSPPYVFTGIPRGWQALAVVSSYKGQVTPLQGNVTVQSPGDGRTDQVTVRVSGGP